MSAIQQFAKLVCSEKPEHSSKAIGISRNALIDTIACMYAGSQQPVTVNTLAAVRTWGSGDSVIIGRNERLSPPFAAMVNGAAGHALDYDDFDEPANAHPSVVIFPALLAISGSFPAKGIDLLDAYIVGLELIQRLGEAMNMDHYRRGWLSTRTFGTIGAAAACARLQRYNYDKSVAALSLAASMASGLTNQGGYLAKQLNPGMAAKNGVMAASLAGSGITASDQVLDGSTSMANTMGEYHFDKFTSALAKLGNPWSIQEHGLFIKSYPACGYTHRAIEAAISIHPDFPEDHQSIKAIEVSVPDYYFDLLVYPNPSTAEEAMFSLEYNVATALLTGGFGLSALNDSALTDPVTRKLMRSITAIGRKPRDPNIVYDPLDPDYVKLDLHNGEQIRRETRLLTGSPDKPLSDSALKSKYDECLQSHKPESDRDELWFMLSQIETQGSLNRLLQYLSKPSTVQPEYPQ